MDFGWKKGGKKRNIFQVNQTKTVLTFSYDFP